LQSIDHLQKLFFVLSSVYIDLLMVSEWYVECLMFLSHCWLFVCWFDVRSLYKDVIFFILYYSCVTLPQQHICMIRWWSIVFFQYEYHSVPFG
jgi:hypothetical protein